MPKKNYFLQIREFLNNGIPFYVNRIRGSAPLTTIFETPYPSPHQAKIQRLAGEGGRPTKLIL